ncbi:MAG TPA: EAL domain-containing protein [Nocardioidaceae bacterium]|nr:EAL domain-containing protein [Nocardioidaceae bacterium]
MTSFPEIGLLRELGEELDRVASPVELLQVALPICLALVACSSIELTLSASGQPGVPLTGSLDSGTGVSVQFTHPDVAEPSPPAASGELMAVLAGPDGDEVRLVARGGSDQATSEALLDVAARLVVGALWRIMPERDALGSRVETRSRRFLRPNSLSDRSVLYDEGPRRIDEGSRKGRTSALLVLDLDNFKQVNDTLGHQAGDAVLAEIGRRLRAALPATYIAASIGGDEFAVLATDLQSAEDSDGVAHKVLKALEAPITIDDVLLHVEASLGIAVHNVDGGTLENLMLEADKAMYQAKALGSRKWQRRTPTASGVNGSAEPLTREEIRRALARDELVMHYQPQVAAPSGEVVGVEALVRWEHPRHGLLLARDFVDLAERSGLMSSLNSTVLELSLGDFGRIRRIAPTASLSLNVSARSLLGEGLVQNLRQALESHDVAPSLLTIEITEPPSDYSRSTMQVLGELEQLGCSVSVHEFGRGRTSLSVLSRYPVIREIKVDPGLVRMVASQPEAARVVGAIVAMAHALDVRVVAEGVEVPLLSTALHQLGCDVLQGYYIKEALPLTELEDWLATSPIFRE